VRNHTDGIQREHLSGYQARDREVVDYGTYELEDTGLQFRGPAPPNLEPGNYFTCIGAAQTFGCFCERPFPSLLADRLGIPALNLGYGGAGPEFFARKDALARYVNGGRFAIIQVMSARSQSNSLFDSGGLEYLVRRSDGARLAAAAAYDRLLGGPQGLGLRRVPMLGRLTRLVTVPRVRRIVAETRRRWIDSYKTLLDHISVPTVLFWFSKRHPSYVEEYSNVAALFGEFPQLVNSEMVDAVRPMCDEYVECISDRGSPQPLRSRFTGEPVAVDPAADRPDFRTPNLWTHNTYYPSPEMHQDAADALMPACERLLQSRKVAGHQGAPAR
jgi:hypothetical protein